MIPRQYIVTGAVLVALVIGGWFLVGRLFPSNHPGPTKNEKTADSLDITRPIDKALIDSLDARIASRALVSNRAEAGARTSQESANRAKRIADSLAIERKWENAYTERSAEAVSLRTTVAQKDTIIVALKADTTDLRTQLGVVNRRLAKTEAVVVGLRWDLEQARQCKILGFINCPSRIQTAAMTAVAYFAVNRYQHK